MYPKFEREANLLIEKKFAEKRNPRLERLRENVSKVKNIFINEHKLFSKND